MKIWKSEKYSFIPNLCRYWRKLVFVVFALFLILKNVQKEAIVDIPFVRDLFFKLSMLWVRVINFKSWVFFFNFSIYFLFGLFIIVYFKSINSKWVYF